MWLHDEAADDFVKMKQHYKHMTHSQKITGTNYLVRIRSCERKTGMLE